MDVSPVDDTFISGSMDDSIRLWDFRSNSCQGLAQLKGRPSVAFDPQGLVFSAIVGDQSVRLFDLRNFDRVRFMDEFIDCAPGSFRHHSIPRPTRHHHKISTEWAVDRAEIQVSPSRLFIITWRR